jgi:fatty acid desaturase
MNDNSKSGPWGSSGCEAPDPGGGKDDKPKRSKRAPMLPAEALPLYRSVKVDDLQRRNPWVPVTRALLVHGLAAAALCLVAWLTGPLGAFAIACGVLLAAPLAPFYRGLENLVHGAAHRDLCAEKGPESAVRATKLNDRIANGLCAIPVGQDVPAFRKTHLADHHGGFDLPRDPCRTRMLAHPDVVRGLLPTLATTLRHLPGEIAGFYRTVGGKPDHAIRGMAWHAAIYGAPLAWWFGPGAAVLAWASIFIPLFGVALPAIRAVAEAGEHDYRAAASGLPMAQRTFAHDGSWNRIFHLFDDDLHPEHHLWPSVPQYHLRRLRERAIQAGLGKFMLRRTTLLGAVESYE